MTSQKDLWNSSRQAVHPRCSAILQAESGSVELSQGYLCRQLCVGVLAELREAPEEAVLHIWVEVTLWLSRRCYLICLS